MITTLFVILFSYWELHPILLDALGGELETAMSALGIYTALVIITCSLFFLASKRFGFAKRVHSELEGWHIAIQKYVWKQFVKNESESSVAVVDVDSHNIY